MTAFEELRRIEGALEQAICLIGELEAGALDPDGYHHKMSELAEAHADVYALTEATKNQVAAEAIIQDCLDEVRGYMEAERVAS